jgi:eukaryotic-like serine/threonine-protein kinase
MRKQFIISICNLGIALLFIWLCVLPNRFRQSAEWWGYDTMMRLPWRAPASSCPIVLVDIDNTALENFGPWPWPRSRLAEGIQKAASLGAGPIGLPLPLDTPQSSASREAVAGLGDTFKKAFGPPEDPKVKAFSQALQDLQQQLDQDGRLAKAMATAGNVILPARLLSGTGAEPLSPEARQLFVQRSREVYGIAQGADFPRKNKVILPLPEFLSNARNLGALSLQQDADGTVREGHAVFWCQDRPVASFSLALAAAYLQIPEKELRMQAGHVLSFNGHQIPLSPQGAFLTRFDAASRSLPRYGFTDLLAGKIPASALSDKLVLFNLSATGLGPRVHTPIDRWMPLGELCGHRLWTLLQGEPIEPTAQEGMTALILVVLGGLFISFLLPRLPLWRGALLCLLMALALGAGSIWLFMSQKIWLQVVFPMMELAFGLMVTVLVTALNIPCVPEKMMAQQAVDEMQRLQGLSLQSQGLPDMAWARLRSLPVNDDMKGALYALALDFEQQGQPEKALRVYEHIEIHDAEFRDIQIRMSRLAACGETMDAQETVDPEASSSPSDQDQPQVPKTLGRYELVRPIGAGSMGTVYLGRDPRINRDTAIKLYRLVDGYDPSEAAVIKRKFFREAESAGNLSHPGIVTIFDAGEQDQLAYIAMEFLEGRDLRSCVKKDSLLSLRRAIEYVADIAEALAYAHRQGVVHRDIKPANIMLLNTGGIKITDFGIARIMASSNTRTGVVKGTPYYMAPEQIIGKKVDGRSDIFSLGVVLFQLLTGQLPFTAETPGELMHKIVHEPHPDPKSLAPSIFTAVVKVIDLALEKQLERRYQDAGLMAAHLRKIGQKIDAIVAQRKAMRQIHRK